MAKSARSIIDPPSFLTTLGEFIRTPFEIVGGAVHALTLPDRSRSDIPIQERTPIVMVPGYGMNELTMWGLREVFRRAGYEVYTPDIWINHGGSSVVTAAMDCLDRASQIHQRAPYAVGHSAGGLALSLGAFRLAQRLSSLSIEHLYTLATPFGAVVGRGGVISPLVSVQKASRIFEEWARPVRELEENLQDGDIPVGGLTVVVASHDGIVAEKAALGPRGVGIVERVNGSHCGMGFKRAVSSFLVEDVGRRDALWRGENALSATYGRVSARPPKKSRSRRSLPTAAGLDLRAA